MEDFKCKACGKCCSKIEEVVLNLGNLASLIGEENCLFPFKVINHRCENLLSDNKCAVYDNRPIICNLQKLPELIATHTGQDIIIIREYVFSEQKKICVSHYE